MLVFEAACLAACRARGLRVLRCLEGALVTSVDAHGASLSLLHLDDDGVLLRLLDAPCDSPALKTGCFRKLPDNDDASSNVTEPAPALCVAEGDDPEEEDDFLAASAPLLRKAILAACDAVEALEKKLTELDTKVGDGDCGTTLAAGARAVRQDVVERPAIYAGGAPRAMAAIARVVATTMGGSSGALYTLGFRAAETALRARQAREPRADAAAALKEAYVAFARAISDCGGAGVGSATMCDATLPAADVLASPEGHLAAACAAAQHGADSTATISATHGRSAHVAVNVQLGIPDPGAVAVAEMFKAVLAAFSD
mmetsp:Transcript_15032/g.45490  ORF Transcript_15032/g.45490 Transcript_15032/m.45490 type:complete len:314 (+) Transcript_15032:236-1177(+)